MQNDTLNDDQAELEFIDTPVLYTFNGFIATSPFAEVHLKMKVQAGFGTVEQRGTLQELEVLFDTHDLKFSVGDKVYVSGDAIKHAFASNILALNGKTCILVPSELVVACLKKNVGW